MQPSDWMHQSTLQIIEEHRAAMEAHTAGLYPKMDEYLVCISHTAAILTRPQDAQRALTEAKRKLRKAKGASIVSPG